MRLSFLNILAAAAIAVPAVFASPANAQTKIVIGYTPNAEAASVYVAKEKGFFEKHGLNAEPVPVAINSTLPAALMSDSVNFGATTAPVFLQAVDNGLDLTAVSGLPVTSKTATGVGIVAKAGSNITGPKDLMGKKVAAPGLGAVLHVMARHWMMENGADPDKVTFIEGAFPAHGDLLKSGTVDAVITVDPFLGRMAGAGIGTPVVNLLADMPEGQTAQFFSTSGAWASRNPQAVKAFREALAEGAAFVVSNPEETRAAVGKYLKLPPEVLKTIALPKSDAAVSPAQISWWIAVMQKQKMLQTDIDPSKYVLK